MRFLGIMTAAGLALSAPLFAQDASYDANTVVATVNERDITLGHMIAIMELLPEQYRSLPDEQLFPGILDQLVDQALIADTVSASAETDPARVRLILENQRLDILSRAAIDKVTEVDPDEAELQKLYQADYGDLPTKVEYNASHILVETLEAAQAIVTDLEGGADFAEVAKEKSTGPSGPNGGALGWFGPGAMVPPFDAAVQAMEVGAISEPVETQFGWHVILLNESRDVPPPSLDDVREELTAKLMQTVIGETIEAMRQAATVERPETKIPASAIREFSLLD